MTKKSENQVEWSAKKFRRAAEVHYVSCNYMLKHIEQGGNDSSQIYLEVYYLSGYVLECILKGLLLEVDKEKHHYTEEEIRNLGLWTHEINNLWVEACDKAKLRETDFTWSDLTKKWNSELRYESKRQDIAKIKEHYEKTVVPIYNKIREIY